jgi:hypothetical protein
MAASFNIDRERRHGRWYGERTFRGWKWGRAQQFGRR